MSIKTRLERLERVTDPKGPVIAVYKRGCTEAERAKVDAWIAAREAEGRLVFLFDENVPWYIEPGPPTSRRPRAPSSGAVH